MKIKKLFVLLLAIMMIAALLVGCADKKEEPQPEENQEQKEETTENPGTDQGENQGGTPAVVKNGETYVLFTSDVHCGVDQGFGYVGLKQIRDTLEAQGYETVLVDDGDAIQGETIGTLTKGEAIIDLMNKMKYDVAIPGNHEFDYGMDRFFELTRKAEYPYISCNFTYNDELVFRPYIIKECAGVKIAFVGVTTPRTIASSAPSYFQNENGEFVYGFMQDGTGEKLYAAVQSAVDAARTEGADVVYLMGHIGNSADCSPWTYADILSHTSGIDVLLDGHSHDTDQVKMKNKDGKDVVRSACGTKMNCIGYSRLTADKKVAETGIWSWTNSVSAPQLMGIENEMTPVVKEMNDNLNAQINKKVATSEVLLTVNDPDLKDASGNPVRMVRRAETNLGDLCADAYRSATGAEIAFINGGGIRKDIAKGDITNKDIINVHPFGNQACMIKATGQQILDALEWSVRSIPSEFGGFLQVSGMRFEVDLSVASGCQKDANGMMSGIVGERRVKNVFVGTEAIDPARIYTVAGTDYTLLNHGDGYTAFDGAEVVAECVKLDNQTLIDFIVEELGGVIGAEYADPHGQGRITIINAEN